ncbi:MAG TPA: hypothetical protein VJN71_02925 [Nitrososphaerales archaeon]|nr:hypothetical protein [Nitrososphaerales archaeon]
MQIRKGLFVVTLAVIIVAAFSTGFGYSYFGKQPIVTTNISTSVTYVSISGTNHSLFYVTEVVVVEPADINDICIGQITNATVTTNFLLPNEGINGSSNPLGILTTQTFYQNSTTTTIYNNITEVNNGVTCTLTNPHYGSSQSSNCPICV